MRKWAFFALWVFVFFFSMGASAFSAPAGPEQEQLDLALMKAAHDGTVQDVQNALAAGGDPNAARFGPGGLTPLMFVAAHNPDEGVISALLKAGAKTDARTATGETALFFAVRYGRRQEIVNALLAAPLPKEAALAMLNARDWRGWTALLLSVDNGNRSTAEALLLAGADGTMKDAHGLSAFARASNDSRFHNSSAFVAASPEVAQAKAEREAREAIRQREAEDKATGGPEPEAESVADPSDDIPDEGDDAEKYANVPGLLPKDLAALDPVRENAGINLGRYSVDNPGAELPALGEPSSLSLFAEVEMPVLDGALASFPLYSAFARACYTGLAPFSAELWKNQDGELPWNPVVKYSNTISGYIELLEKNIDIYFGVEPDAWLKSVLEYDRKLVYTPLGREAFIFFTHKDNPVSNLTRAQIKDIYAGKIANWKEVGGLDQPILAFQRNQGSGSQAAMERFMGDTALAHPPTELLSYGMERIVLDVARYRPVPNALGYSFYYFATQLAADENVKLISVDGVAPGLDTIRDSSYPLLETRWAISLRENVKPAVARFLEWMQGPQGQKITRDMGRVGNGD